MKRYFIISLLLLGPAVQIQGAQVEFNAILANYNLTIKRAGESNVEKTVGNEAGKDFLVKQFSEEQWSQLSSEERKDVLILLVNNRVDFGNNLLMNVLAENLPGSDAQEKGAALNIIISTLTLESSKNVFVEKAIQNFLKSLGDSDSSNKTQDCLNFVRDLPDSVRYEFAKQLASASIKGIEQGLQDEIYPGFSQLQILENENASEAQKQAAREKIFGMEGDSEGLFKRAFLADESFENRSALIDALVVREGATSPLVIRYLVDASNQAHGEDKKLYMKTMIKLAINQQDIKTGYKLLVDLNNGSKTLFEELFPETFIQMCENDPQFLRKGIVFLQQGKGSFIEAIKKKGLAQKLFTLGIEEVVAGKSTVNEQLEFFKLIEQFEFDDGVVDHTINYILTSKKETLDQSAIQRLNLFEKDLSNVEKPKPKSIVDRITSGISKFFGVDDVFQTVKKPTSQNLEKFFNKNKDNPEKMAEFFNKLGSFNEDRWPYKDEWEEWGSHGMQGQYVRRYGYNKEDILIECLGKIREQIESLQDQGKFEEAKKYQNTFLQGLNEEYRDDAQQILHHELKDGIVTDIVKGTVKIQPQETKSGSGKIAEKEETPESIAEKMY